MYSHVQSALLRCLLCQRRSTFGQLRTIYFPIVTLIYSLSFGEICSVQMISDISLILLNSFWCLAKAYHAQSVVQYRYELIVGVVGCRMLQFKNNIFPVSKTLYFFTCKLHVLMAVNRYIFIFHVTENKVRNALLLAYTCFFSRIILRYSRDRSVSVSCLRFCSLYLVHYLVLAFIITENIGSVLDPNLFVVFSSDTLRWQFASTEWTAFYEAWAVGTYIFCV